MNRVLLIAQRDYLQTVRSKAYLFALILLPVLLSGGFLAVAIANRGSAKEQRVAVIDRTGISAPAIIAACTEANRKARLNQPGGFGVGPHYVYEEVKPESDQSAQLLALSNRIRRGDLLLVVDISSEALQPSGDPKQQVVRYYANSGGIVDPLTLWLPAAVNDGLRRVRLGQLGVDPGRVKDLMQEVKLVPMNLVTRDPATGAIIQGEKKNSIQSGLVTFFLVILLVMIVIFGSAPNLGGVAEDKMQRVFEMLLTSASPLELMMGKVIAAVGACLTSSTVYIVAGLAALAGMAIFGLAPLHLIPWFFVYLIADVVMLSGLAVALGAACATPQDAQHLAFLLIVPVFVPMMMIAPVMQQPNAAFAVVMSFIPPFTPVLMLLRQASPGGIPPWQPWVGLGGIAVYGFAAIWAAARIFRIGILSQGKTPQISELAQWVFED